MPASGVIVHIEPILTLSDGSGSASSNYWIGMGNYSGIGANMLISYVKAEGVTFSPEPAPFNTPTDAGVVGYR